MADPGLLSILGAKITCLSNRGTIRERVLQLDHPQRDSPGQDFLISDSTTSEQ
jgi:hypothetical protein